jgi:hypothetical protein
MKNVSFMQLLLGVTGGLLVYAGIKDIDIITFFHTLVTNPSGAFTASYKHIDAAKIPASSVKPSSNTTTGTATPSPVQNV